MFKGTFLKNEYGFDFADVIKSTDKELVKQRAIEATQTGDPFVICDFAEFVPLADTPEVMKILEDGMIACGDIYHEYEFAFCMADSNKKNFNLKRFEEHFRECGIAKIMYYCMECLKGCDLIAMEDALMSTKDTKYIEHLMNNEEVDRQHSSYWYKSAIENFERVHEKSAYGKYLPNDIAVETVYGDDDAILAYAIDKSQQTGNPMYINMAAEYTDCNKRDALGFMMSSNNILHIYEYYCSAATEGQKDVIFDYILNSGYAKIMYYMIAWTDLPVDKCYIMLDAIEATGNKKYYEKAREAVAVKEDAIGKED